MDYIAQLRDYLASRERLRITPLSRVYDAAVELEKLGEVRIHRAYGTSSVVVELVKECGGVVTGEGSNQ